MKRTKQIITAAIIAAIVAGFTPSTANAYELVNGSPANVARECSIPYVDDVNDAGRDYVATVCVNGRANAIIKVKSGKKTIKAKKVKRNVWLVNMKRGKTYKIAARVKNGKWRKIAYKIF